jgi:enoyl-CoA hydratase/carnithine racemase/DNA-binding MarR family transcriptional regulator
VTLRKRAAPAPLLDTESIGLEGRVVSDDHQSLKVWLRLLSCSTQVETTIRKRLRQEAGITMARFDFMAQLHRHPEGLTMSVLSRYLMVTGGNVTGLADELEKEKLVERIVEPHDRRSSRVSLTKKGRRLFDRIAATHETWIRTMFGGMTAAEMRQLYDLLGKLRVQLADQPEPVVPPSASAARRTRKSGVMSTTVDPSMHDGTTRPLAGYVATHFGWTVTDRVAVITLDRPERKNPLTFASYAELRDLFERLRYADDVQAVVITGAGGNFSSGGDVHEIIGPLVGLSAPDLLKFTRMTGALVKAMRHCPQPIVAAIDGVCAGAGAILAMASDLRIGTARSRTAFLFNRVGLAGCDMGACALLPRIIGQGRASELLFTGRSMPGDEALQWGFLNRIAEPDAVLAAATALAHDIAHGPTFANGLTKAMLHQEWAMSVDDAIDAEAQVQALCMLTEDFGRAYRAFVAKERPTFEGN